MRGGPHPVPAPRPSLIYCASPMISYLLIPHLELSKQLINATTLVALYMSTITLRTLKKVYC
jgi:hypothetical protein